VPDTASFELGPGVKVVWDDLDALRASLTDPEARAPWRLEGDLGTGFSALRVLTVATEAGSLLLVAGARPAGADGHDAENPQAALISGSGDVTVMEEALVSTQYAANGNIERATVELYAEGDDYPVRGAGDAVGAAGSDEGPVRRECATLEFRLDGESGFAVFDVLHSIV